MGKFIDENQARQTIEKWRASGLGVVQFTKREGISVRTFYSELSRENDRLRLRILELTRKVHGRSSEKIDPNALRKALEELRAQEFAQQAKSQPEAAPDEPAVSPPAPPKAPQKPRKPHPGRAPLPPHLPREERRHALVEAERICECCQQPKQRIREEVAERLDYVPSRFVVIRDVTEVYGCGCGLSRPVAAASPPRVIDGGLPEPGLLAHKGYDALTGGPALAIRVGCFMHLRRYFLGAFKAGAIDAAIPIDIIQRLYRIEHASKEAGEDEGARLRRRREFSAPLMDEFDAWFAKHDGRHEPRSPLGKAITYLRRQRGALGAFLLDGRIELDNGAVERTLRVIAVGRHNWLFAGSDAGAERAAILYTVITSAKLHGLEPYAYLRDVLAKLGAGWPNRRLDELMPDRWGHERGIAPPPLPLTVLTEAT